MKSQIEQLQRQIAAYNDLEDFVSLDFLKSELIRLQQQYIESLERLV